MAETLLWIIKGPAAGKVAVVDDVDAERAEREHWGQNFAGRGMNDFSVPTPGPHRDAERWLAKQARLIE